MNIRNAAMTFVTVSSLIVAIVCASRVGHVSNQVKAEGQAQVAAAVERYAVDEAALVERGFETAATLEWQEEEGAPGFLTAQAPNGGVCVKVDRNGADGLFCTGAVQGHTDGVAESDGRELFQMLARMHNYSAATAEVSRAEKYRAIQRDLTEGVKAVERMQQAAGR